MQRSDSSEHSPAVSKLALHLSLWLSRFSRQSQRFRVKGSVQFVTFASRPASKENLRLRNDSSNEFLTRSNVNQQQVSDSFRRAPRSFQIRSPTSLTLVLTSSALAPDSQLTVAIDRGQATTVLSEHHNKEQRKRTQRRSATMFAVFLLCVLRDYLCLTPGLCAQDDHRACRVTSVHTLSTTTKED